MHILLLNWNASDLTALIAIWSLRLSLEGLNPLKEMTDRVCLCFERVTG